MYRQHLHFIQDDDATRDVVELPTFASAATQQALEKLDGCCHNQRCIPVLGSKSSSDLCWCRVLRILQGDIAMVLDESLFIGEDATEHPGCLIDNAGVGNGIDDALEVVLERVLERE